MQMESALEKETTCSICCESYLEGEKEPVVIPECGHTFCKPCLILIQSNNENFPCPYCRTPSYEDVESFPINYVARAISIAWHKFKTPTGYLRCSEHNEYQKLWCLDCEGPLCAMCSFESPMHQGHKVITYLEQMGRDINDLKEDIRKHSHFLGRTIACLKAALAPPEDLEGQHSSPVDDVLEQILKNKNLKAFDDAIKARAQITCLLKSMSQNILKSIENRQGTQNALICAAVAEDGRCGRLMLHDDELCLYTICETENDAHLMIKLSTVQLLLPPKNVRIFMDLSCEGEVQGRLHMCVWTNLRRAQHFLTLCLGLQGQSYKGTKLTKIVNQGVTGESFVGGQYQQEEDASATSSGLMDELEWGSNNVDLGNHGMVVGFGDNINLNSLFCIVLSELPRNFKCPFGVVESGLAILNKAASHDPPKVITITDIGVILSGKNFPHAHL